MRKGRIIVGIARETLDFIFDVSKANHPQEFIGLLHADEDIITDVVLLPGTRSSDSHALMQLNMMPMGVSYVGSVHSHPHPGAMKPSEQDLFMFSRTGNCHIITFYPYTKQSWHCYNAQGELIELKIMDKIFEDLEPEGKW
jgi:proteasome lid subunit RPN8/RPN11